jgi:hypothetical protein
VSCPVCRVNQHLLHPSAPAYDTQRQSNEIIKLLNDERQERQRRGEIERFPNHSSVIEMFEMARWIDVTDAWSPAEGWRVGKGGVASTMVLV